jgi:hypothetical protein
MVRVGTVGVEPTKQLHFGGGIRNVCSALNINDVLLKTVRSKTLMEGAV